LSATKCRRSGDKVRATLAALGLDAGERAPFLLHLLGVKVGDGLDDLTLEAVEPLFDVAIEGFGELFRMLSYHQVGAAAMLSRAAAGLIGERAVFLLPGSPKAVALAMETLILPEAGHLLAQARRPSSL